MGTARRSPTQRTFRRQWVTLEIRYDVISKLILRFASDMFCLEITRQFNLNYRLCRHEWRYAPQFLQSVLMLRSVDRSHSSNDCLYYLKLFSGGIHAPVFLATVCIGHWFCQSNVEHSCLWLGASCSSLHRTFVKCHLLWQVPQITQ